MTTRQEWLKRNRDWLITLAVFLLFAILLALYGTFLRNGEEKIPVADEAPLTFEAPTEPAANGSAGQEAENERESAAVGTTSFFLNPAPGELLSKLENLSYQEFREETANLPGLRVMWPAYFFSVREVSGKTAQVLFDADPSGFGVTLLATIDVSRYPDVLVLEPGRKIWLAGVITGVDPAGTGQFLLDAEYVRFDDYQPPTRKNSPAEAKGE